jgi:hypothetical protein
VRWLLIASLAMGGVSSLVVWVCFATEFLVMPRAFNGTVYVGGWYLFWGCMATCTIAALVSAVAGWHVLSRWTSN